MSTLYQRVRACIAEATRVAAERQLMPARIAPPDVPLERPKKAGQGELSTNLCFQVARAQRSNPRAMAEGFVQVLTEVDVQGLFERVEVAGPGFVNLHLAAASWQSAITDVLDGGQGYGQTRTGAGERVLVEFVSANPTGPLHVGHGRGAVHGDALAHIMRAAGYRVDTEYYINNVGNQIGKLGESVWHWLRALAPMDETRRAAQVAADPPNLPEGFPEDGYRGAYVTALAASLFDRPDTHLGLDAPHWQDDAWWAAAEPDSSAGRADDRAISRAAWRAMLRRIAADLDGLGVRFDSWFSERGLHGLERLPGAERSFDAVASCCDRLEAADWAYKGEADDAGRQPLQFRGTSEAIPKAFRDDKDRVILRSDGRPTYFAADIAYHDDKLARGYDHMVNIFGADHHGYVPRLKGVIHAVGDLRRGEGDPRAARWSGDRLEVILMQMVALLRNGEPVSMGKRSGDFITLRDVMDEVSTGADNSGRDAVRFIFLTRKGDAQLDFDLEVARKTTMDNPVYYVQYGHARLVSILQRAEAQNIAFDPSAVEPSKLTSDDEKALAMTVAAWPEVVARAARAREPHLVAFYLMDACKQFHGYYSRGKAEGRVITDDVDQTRSRLALIAALRLVIGNGLRLLGVDAPDRMHNLDEGPATG